MHAAGGVRYNRLMAAPPTPTTGVNLPAGKTASSFMLELLRETKTRFPQAMGPVRLPATPRALKRRYASLLVEVEQRRCASEARVEIARSLRAAVLERCTLRGDDGSARPLDQLDLETALPLDVEPFPGGDPRGWVPSFRYGDRAHRGHELASVVDELEARRRVNAVTAATLRRALARLDDDGALRLSPSTRFALLGAGAELAPTRALLQAGATVLWADVTAPPASLRREGGPLTCLRGRADLLTVPDRIGASVAAFLDEAPAHVGLFAYGPGGGREWRIGAAMNAIVEALPRSHVLSVGMLVSPTTPVELEADDAAAAEKTLAGIRGWRRVLWRARLLRPTRARPDLPPVSDTIVPIQGMSYQAAQWLEKTMAAEVWRRDAEAPLRVSANVAPITKTESMSHPLFKVGFRAADTFGVEIFEPDVTRTLGTLMYVEDILGDDPPDRARQLHGGSFGLPYSGESALAIATAIGFTRRPEKA